MSNDAEIVFSELATYEEKKRFNQRIKKPHMLAQGGSLPLDVSEHAKAIARQIEAELPLPNVDSRHFVRDRSVEKAHIEKLRSATGKRIDECISSFPGQLPEFQATQARIVALRDQINTLAVEEAALCVGILEGTRALGPELALLSQRLRQAATDADYVESHIVRIHDHGDDEKNDIYLNHVEIWAGEYCDAQSKRQLIHHRIKEEYPGELAECTKAVQEAQNKMQNIILQLEGLQQIDNADALQNVLQTLREGGKALFDSESLLSDFGSELSSFADDLNDSDGIQPNSNKVLTDEIETWADHFTTLAEDMGNTFLALDPFGRVLYRAVRDARRIEKEIDAKTTT